MKIALVTNGLRYGGAERIVEALALDLAAGGVEVHVVATTRGGPVRDTLLAAGIPVSVLHIASPFDLRVPLKLFEVAARFGADLLHSHLAVADIATSIAAPLLGIPAVTTIHNTGLELSRFKKLLWRSSLAGFARVLAVSEPVQRALPPDVHPSILRPSLISERPPALTRIEARRRLGVQDDRRKLILGVGRLEPIKGFDVLDAAVGQLNGARALVIGEGSEKRSLRALELVGARDDAAELMIAADVVVCPSRSEGFPQVPLHAMAAGVPVVATAVGGTPEIVEHRRTGLLVPPDDPCALAAALSEILDDRDQLATRLAQNARRRLLERRLTREAMTEAHLDVYRSVVNWTRPVEP